MSKSKKTSMYLSSKLTKKKDRDKYILFPHLEYALLTKRLQSRAIVELPYYLNELAKSDMKVNLNVYKPEGTIDLAMIKDVVLTVPEASVNQEILKNYKNGKEKIKIKKKPLIENSSVPLISLTIPVDIFEVMVMENRSYTDTNLRIGLMGFNPTKLSDLFEFAIYEKSIALRDDMKRIQGYVIQL